jgi:hypothetical protein
MRHSTIAMISLIGTVAFALPAMAQDDSSVVAHPDTQSRAVQGQSNTTIVFMPADASDLDASRLHTWGEFAEMHPKVAKTLAYKPALINDDAYLSKHPELDAFFQAHPDIKEAMAENPGNFVAIPPRPGE